MVSGSRLQQVTNYTWAVSSSRGSWQSLGGGGGGGGGGCGGQEPLRATGRLITPGLTR